VSTAFMGRVMRNAAMPLYVGTRKEPRGTAGSAIAMDWKTAVWALMIVCAAMGAVAQESDSKIQPGDTVFIDVYRRAEFSSTQQVDSEGNVQMSYIGDVHIAGTTNAEAADRIAKALRQVLKNPRVTVSRTLSAPPVVGLRTADMKTQVIALNNSDAENLSKQLESMCSTGGSVSFDRGTNSVIITDTPVTIQNIMTAISQIDQMPTQVTQVRIDAKIAEVEQGAMKELGVRWFVGGQENTFGYYPNGSQNALSNLALGQSDSLANERVGGMGSTAYGSGMDRRFVDEPKFDRRLNVPVQVPILGQLFYGLLNDHVDIGVMLDALVKDNKAELLASPYTLALNHSPAEIKMTDEFPYTESSQVFGSTQYSVRFMDLGIKMVVTPHVYKDARGPYVKLELSPEVSFPNGVSNGVPIRSVRSSKGTAVVRDGQTLAIGGIMLDDERNIEQHVPGLGKLPLVGNLFKRKERARTRNELMVFVTPKIYDTPEQVTWDRMISMTGVSKESLPSIPTNETQGEIRKE